jgi:ribosomal protein S18 acetylase RimI-like enzyme
MPTESLRRSPLPPPSRLPQAELIRPIRPTDRLALARLVSQDALFTREEVSVALELIDGALAEANGDYRVLVADGEGPWPLAGYVCYGPTPMTAGTWDLYWIVTHPEARGRGVARALVERMEAELRASGARLVRVETSHLDNYGAAHAFYRRLEYPVVARVPDFYRPGDDLLVMMKRL